MAYASPLLQLNQELANPKLTLETINQLAIQYEEKINFKNIDSSLFFNLFNSIFKLLSDI